MLDILTAARERLFDPEQPQDVAIATIISAQGSVPRQIGTSMLVDATGVIHGSLTGGCVEGAVVELCTEVLGTGVATVQRFGYSDEDAFTVGLMCGGSIDVLVQPFRAGDPGLDRGAEETAGIVLRIPSAAAPSASTTSRCPAVAIGSPDGGSLAEALELLVPPAALSSAPEAVRTMLRESRSGRIRLAAAEGETEPIELFVDSRTRPARMIVLGANAFSRALVTLARALDYRITVCDPRPAFTDPDAFPGAEVVRAWPHRLIANLAASDDLDSRSAICVLTHDPKVDTPALIEALGLDVAYVGAMGSRRSDRQRRDALRKAGVDAEALERLHSPIGLDIGALTPAEVAVAILAEILASRHGRAQVSPLSHGSGPLHPPAPDDSR